MNTDFFQELKGCNWIKHITYTKFEVIYVLKQKRFLNWGIYKSSYEFYHFIFYNQKLRR